MARPGIVRLFHPFERFFRLEASSSIVLLGAAAAALVWANSPARGAYDALWSAKAIVGVGGFALDKALILWINDGLMAVFFLLVGLEIKRELLRGELRSPRAAALPVAAAVGGMVVPALIYAALNPSGDTAAGWGIPMATDIAFALGALAILGRGLPPSLRVFLAAAAIVDDIGAVLVIAFVYTPSVAWIMLLFAAVVLGLLVALNRLDVHHPFPYVALGLVLWVLVLKSGVHATVAGVLLAFTIPAARPAPGPEAHAEAREAWAAAAAPGGTPAERAAALLAAEHLLEEQESLLTRMEHALVPWVAYGILPVFALANAGVALEGSPADLLLHPVSLGIVLGLVLGKQIGMTLAPWLAVRLGFAALPAGATWRHLHGVAALAGIGFTMSLFIAGLALPPEMLPTAKVGILSASLLATAAGALILKQAGARARRAR